MQPQGLLAPRGRGGVLPTFAAAGLAGAVGTIALYPVRALPDLRCQPAWS